MASVKIGCKLPHGIWLEIIDCDPAMRNVSPQGPRVFIRGANDSSVYVRGTNPSSPVIAWTHIDKAFWDKWLATADNKNFEFIKSGALFVADENPKEAQARAKDHATVKTGFEPLDVGADGKFNDPRMPKSIAADQEHMARLAQERRV